ncbi:MAG: transcriptional/translational regulatory protein YebC/TACO1, partial [Congregibacter sp.]
RLCFNKTKCKLGNTGSVSHMFDHNAIFVFSHNDEEAVLESLMMAEIDVSDIESEDGKVTVFTPHTEYFKARQAIIDEYGETEFEVDEIQFVPQLSTPLGDEDRAVLDNLIDMLDYLEDVQNIYHTAP